MDPAWAKPRPVWILPIAIAICAVMVLSGAGAMLLLGSSASHSGGGSATPASSAAASSSAAESAHNAPASSGSSFGNALSDLGSIKTLAAEQLTADEKQVDADHLQPITSLPAAGLLQHGVTVGQDGIVPLYTTQPAPIGIGDFGLGASGPYAYNTSSVLGSITFNSQPNATNPGASDTVDPGATHLGEVASTNEFTIQLNTILTNVTQPGSYNGTYWTQNVLDVSSTGIHFVDDVFNQSGDGVDIAPNAILSGCPGGPSVQDIIDLYGIYQCVGTTIPITAANYPLSIWLWNNASVVNNEDVLTFSYWISGAAGLEMYGISDQLTFNSTGYALTPAYAPAFEVNGWTGTPGGLFYDSEIILGGAIGGSNAVFSSLSATDSLKYVTSTGVWKNVPSAYNFGSDTGETSTGVATYWTTTDTEVMSSGPEMLYGLWNSVAYVQAPSGDIQFSGSISPNYGFVFVSNVPYTTSEANYSWVPTSASGTFNTYLPPSVPPSTEYYVQAFAAGYQDFNAASGFSSSQTGYTISMTALVTVTNPLDTPLYANGNAQAASLETALTGSHSAPYTFDNWAVAPNQTFNHVNDWTYPSFTIFTASNVSGGVTVSNVTETGMFYYTIPYPIPPFTGLISPGGATLGPWYNYTAQIQILYGANNKVSDLTLIGYDINYYGGYPEEGGILYLWMDTATTVWNITSTSYDECYEYDECYSPSAGVFVGDSVGVHVSDVTASWSSTGVTDVGSSGTVTDGINATWYGYGIWVYSSSGGTYDWTNATFDGLGFNAGESYYAGIPAYYWIPGASSATVNNLSGTGPGEWYYAGQAFNITFSTDVTVNNLLANAEGSGGNVLQSVGTTFNNAIVFNAWGIDLWGAEWTNITNYFVQATPGYYDLASVFYGSGNTTVTGFTMLYYEEGIISQGGWDNSFTATKLVGDDIGIILVGEVGDSVTGGTATSSLGVVGAVGVQATTISDISYTNSSNTYEGAGVILEGSSSVTVSGVTVGNYSIGVIGEDVSGATITGVTVFGGSIGVGLVDYSTYDTVKGVTATAATAVSPWLGTEYFGAPTAAVVTEYVSTLTIANVNTTNYPTAYFDEESSGLTVGPINATGDVYGLILNGTYSSVFTGIDAYQDYQGALVEDGADDNVFTAGSFVDDTSYGIVFAGGGEVGYAEYNTVYANSFIGDNGATDTYNAAHIQAASSGYNYFDLCELYGTNGCVVGSGNYWADWHTYGSNGYLAPYIVSGYTIDYFPIGPQETFSVTFTESGLSSGTNWSVTFNGVTHSSTTNTITFSAPMGSWGYTVNGVSGYQLQSGPTGTVTMTGSPVTIAVVYTSTSALATQNTVNGYFALALAIAVIALVVALIAFLMHRRGGKKSEPASSPPQAWTPPAGASSSGSAAGGGSSPPSGASGASWSEGSGAGSPPSS